MHPHPWQPQQNGKQIYSPRFEESQDGSAQSGLNKIQTGGSDTTQDGVTNVILITFVEKYYQLTAPRFSVSLLKFNKGLLDFSRSPAVPRSALFDRNTIIHRICRIDESL